ncbi:MAG: hypothetical protein KC931_01745 [Candidatus Omnitrophica bacterium]|nr:hypothetical protein [Candidatus Omnitrophota bacterium]
MRSKLHFLLACLPALAIIAQSQTVDHTAFQRAPRLLEVEADTLPTTEAIGTPSVRTLLGYTRRVLHLQDNHSLAVFSFSGSAPANWLFLIDSRDLSVKRFSIPNDYIASHGAALGADGNIYIMPYGNGRAHIFDVSSKTFQTIQSDLPKTDYTWDAFGASNGRIYFGTYPNAYLGEFDPKDKQFDLIRQAVPGKKYTIGFSETEDGRIRFKGWGPGETWMIFDPETRSLAKEEVSESQPIQAGSQMSSVQNKEPILPEGDQNISSRINIGDRRFAITFPSSRFYEVGESGELILCGDPKAPAENWFLETCDEVLIGISHFGVIFRYDPESGDFKSKQIDNHAPGGNGIMFIESLGPRCVIGANYSQQNLWKIDPQTGVIDHSKSMIARVTGEPMCAIGHQGKGYLGVYVSSLICRYDPDLPFEFGINPKELIELGAAYKQTRPRDTAMDRERIFMSSDSQYGELGGALAVVDPETEKINVHHHLIRDQNLPTLAFDSESGLLWGGTDRWGQMQSHPPTQESSLIYAFDPETTKVVHRIASWPGTDVTNVIGALPGGVLVSSASNEVALIDTRTARILFRGPVEFSIPRRIRIGSDGEAYCLTGGSLCRWNVQENLLEPIVRSGGASYFTEAGPMNWVFADSTTVYRVQNP